MTGLYVIITVASIACPSSNWNHLVEVGAYATTNVATVTPTVTTIPGVDKHEVSQVSPEVGVEFTRSRKRAEDQLAAGAHVWAVETFPLKVSEWHREATTTYSVKSDGVKVGE